MESLSSEHFFTTDVFIPCEEYNNNDNNNNNNNNNNHFIYVSNYLAEHRGSTNWGDRKSNQHKANQIKCWFLVRGEKRSTPGKTSRSRVENQETQPTYDVRSGNRTWATLVGGECSHHCANNAPWNESRTAFAAQTFLT